MEQKKNLTTLRHSAAHLVAHAVEELFPGTLLTIGPATSEGFFYDFLPQENFKESDLAVIEKRMREIAARNLPLTHEPMDREAAKALYRNNPFKLELIEGISEKTVGIARQGNFYDLCRGGHVASTGDIKYFKLLGISGSYWRADRNNQALQRITGTAFYSQEELDAFLEKREAAIRYDHRRLGKELELFSFHEEGPGFPFFHPNGKTVLIIMRQFLRKKLTAAGYLEIETPTMLSEELWKQSGHYDHYHEHMYFSSVEDKNYAVRPMNCPGSILLYKHRPRSYRELPLRLAEFGHVHRFELSGVTHGLFRARAFTIDDAHIYCRPEEVTDEVLTAIQLTQEVLQAFGFSNIDVRLATRPENSMGADHLWSLATTGLQNALEQAHIPYTVCEGDGAFYGPKIEFHIKDSMDRSWQCGTVQLDFLQPERFELSYVSSDGTFQRPVMIHRAIYGSFERFFAIVLEHYRGKLPFWLAPQQIALLTITDDQKPYATELKHLLENEGARVFIDESSDPISGKIKSAQQKYIPWMCVIGKKEVAEKCVSIRTTDGKQEHGVPIERLIAKIHHNNPLSQN